MSNNKKYYYLKVKENFYDTEEMIILQNMKDGYLYSDILMKLYLRSLKNEGKLMFKDVIPYTPEVLAQVVRHQVGTVEKALHVFQKLGLVEILDNGAIYMMDIQNFIGKSSTEGDRKRAYRNKIDAEESSLLDDKGQMSGQMSDKRPPEIEIEIEKEIERDIKNPTLDEIQKYILNNKLNVNANKFYNYYNSGNWVDSQGNKVINWQQKLVSWNNRETQTEPNNKTYNDYEQRQDVEFNKYYIN